MHCLLISLGSAETQRGEDAVSGSRTPTLLLVLLAGVELPEEPLAPQAASPVSSAMAAPIIAAVRSVARMVLPSFSSRKKPVVRAAPGPVNEGRAEAVRCRPASTQAGSSLASNPAYRLAAPADGGLTPCRVHR